VAGSLVVNAARVVPRPAAAGGPGASRGAARPGAMARPCANALTRYLAPRPHDCHAAPGPRTRPSAATRPSPPSHVSHDHGP